ncbi:MAG: DUF4397 domain-containing protein [Flavisolibacter sp.]|nr:DUF4397 domain-containing protein [Flavisolibacter sp.]
MKYINQLAVLLFLIIVLPSCKKDEHTDVPLATMRIANIVTGGTVAKLAGVSTTNINNNGSAYFGMFAGNPDIYVYPIDDSLHPYYHANKSVEMKENEYFTLFICGTPDTPESVLVKENYTFHSDSVGGIRFINLSPNSTPVNVTLSTNASVNEFENIAYKGITDFKLYPATSAITSYVFEVRAADNPAVILASFTINTESVFRFLNATLVFRGLVGGSPAPGISRIVHL